MRLTATQGRRRRFWREVTPRWRLRLTAIVIVLLGVIQQIDARTGAAPFQHLFYIPIVIAGIGLTPYGGVIVALAAVVLYHVGNPRLLTFAYDDTDIVQIALFIGIGVVTARLASDARRLYRVAQTDDLTGLYNLRGFEPRLGDAIIDAHDTRRPVALLVLDVDRLKTLNDTYGHRTGAAAVHLVGTLIRRHLPPGAFACRFGGDEFVIALPGFDAKAAARVAGAIREAVHREAPALAGTSFPAGTLSVSIGIAASATTDQAVDAAMFGEMLFKTADAALYAAKAAGRNQISLTAV